MSWALLINLIADELGTDAAARIEARARHELGGVRITVCARQGLTREQVDSAAPGRPQEAARVLGVHPVTVYRLLRRGPLVR